VREAIRRVFDRPTPFFQRKLAEAGIAGPDDVKTLDALDAVPLTVKQELRDSEAAHPPVGDYRGSDLRENIRLGTSTGTTGTPTVILWTRHDLLVELEAGARVFWRQGTRPGMIVTHAHPAYPTRAGS
jgi:phenylacetate-CoA ligase